MPKVQVLAPFVHYRGKAYLIISEAEESRAINISVIMLVHVTWNNPLEWIGNSMVTWRIRIIHCGKWLASHISDISHDHEFKLTIHSC